MSQYAICIRDQAPPGVDDEEHWEEDGPSCVGADATTDRFSVEEANEDGADDLGDPVAHVVQASGKDVEDGAVEAAEF
ncbi:uncharacterized protein ARMOST_06438 [Armillaria ostoyae]|uniref:Uncharacterized protein n=1 Tax=Armillaria ostoyae TaxID=47428 RepID=A0A284R326_ARMOS|nr:uncharacterized protein ARMOST_06438 [Armillaria ostoyae]